MQVSGALGVAVLGTISADHTRALLAAGGSLANSLTAGYHLAFVVAAASVGAGMLAAAALLRPSRRAARGRVEPGAESVARTPA
jgi:hypothetical protein